MMRACERRVDQRARRERAHAAGVRPAVVVEDPLVILRGADRQRARAVADDEERHFGTGRHSSITSRSPAAPNRPLAHRRDDRRFGLGAIARRSRRPCRPPARRPSAPPASRTRPERTAASASSSDVAGAEARGRHAVPRHERFRERLARFERAARGRRAEQQAAVSREPVGDADAERQFGADDGEIDLLAVRELGRQRLRSAMSTADGARERGDPGIAGRASNSPTSRSRTAGRRARARARRCRGRELS